MILYTIYYLTPTWIAIKKKHTNKTAIILINLLAGWTIIGWVVALVWAIKKPEYSQNGNISLADEIAKLNDLKEKGIISDKEFQLKRNNFYSSY